MNITSLTVEVKSVGIKQASQELGGLSTSAANAARRIENLVIAVNKLQQASISSASAASLLVAQLQRQSVLMASFQNNSAASAASVQALAAATSLLAAALATLNAQQQLANRSQQQHNQGMREAHGLARGLTGSLGALWVTYGNLAGMAVGLAIGASLKAIVVVGADVEHTLEAIRVRGNESVATINEMRVAISELGQGIYGPREIANAFHVLTLAGLDAKQSLVGIKDALNLATVGGTTIEKAAETLVQVSTALGYTAEGFGRISDVIAGAANASIASVESLSESFRAGSVVGKMYGQGLVDIGTQFAILANLKITGSAAGTAVKNFYSDLNSGSDKVTRGLGLLKLTIKDLQTETGNFRPFVEVMRTLMGDAEKGFNSLTGASQKYVQALITNERGNKLMTEGLDRIRKQGKETASELEDYFKKIDESWGQTAQGAAAMALTVQNQFKSVKNTLQTTLGEAFTEIQPQLSLVATRMKAAFASPEFKAGVQSLATGVANLTAFLVENSEAIWTVVRAFLAFKAASAILGLLTGIAAGFTAVKTAMDLAKISAIAFQASLGVLGLALAASGALLVWWMTRRDEAAGNAIQRAALNYMDDFRGKLDEENKRLEKQIELMQKGATATEAYNQAQIKMQLQKVQQQGQEAISSAETQLNDTWKGIDPRTQKILEDYKRGARPNLDSQDLYRATQGLQAMAKATENLKQVKQDVLTKERETADAVKRNIELSKQAAALAEADAKKRGAAPQGEGVIPPKTNRSAANDAYAAALQVQDDLIVKAKREMTAFEEEQNKLFKAGQIGKLQMIEEVGKKQVETYTNIQSALAGKLNAADVKGDKSEIQRYVGDIKQAEADLANARKTNAASAEQAITNYGETYSRLRIQQLEKEGQYGLAAQERFSTEHSATYKQAAADVEYYAKVAKEALAGGDDKGADEALKKVEAAKRAYEQLGDTQKAAVEAGFNREAMDAFMTSIAEVKNSFKGVQTAYEGQGLAAMFEAASAASENYRNRIDEIKQRMMGLTDPQMIATATAEMNNAAEAQRKMWVGVGETIGSSLESAFGRGGDAMGKLFKVAIDYNNLEKKTGSARIKAYGDAAGAAKNFFKEGSTGYKVLEGAEKAFRALELAGQIQSLVKHLFVTGAKAAATTAGQGVETAAVGAGEAARNLLKIPGVIMSFMSSLGPYGAAAAAVAIAAVLGGAFGGGGGGVDYKERQRTQGTGSVLGDSDAKSESIAKSIEHLEKNSGLGLYHTSEMVKSLKSIQNSMSSLASLIVQSTDLSGKTLATDQGSASKFASSTTGQAVLGGVFGVLADKLTGGWIGKVTGKIANAIFGGKTSNQDVGFTLDKTNLAAALSQGIKAFQYADMKKDGGWFSKDKYYTDKNSLGNEANTQFSSIIGNVANALKEASKMLGVGGDSFTQKLNSFVIDIGKISLKDLSGEEIEKEISAVFSKLGDDMARWALGGFEQFQKVGEGYLETIARVASNLIQVKDVFAVLGQTLDLTGSAAVTVSENLIELAGGIENLTEDTKFYVDNFLTQAERMAPITKSVKERLAELNLSNLTSIELYKQKIQSLNLMNAADRELYVSLIDLAPAFKEAADYAQDLIDGTVDLTDAQEKALDKVKDARTALQDAYDKEKDSLQGVIDKTKSFIQTLANYKDSLKLGADSPLTNMQKYDEAKLQIESVVQKALAGDQEAKDKFTSIANSFLAASKVVNASGNAYTADFNYVQNMIDKLSYAAVGEMTTAEASLVALNKQVEGLLEVNKSVLTVAQAIIDLQKALFEGKSKGLTNEQMGVAAGVVIAPPASGGATSQDKMNEILGNVNNNLVMMREELKQQTGAVVGATYSSGAKVSESVDELANIRVKDNIKVQLA